MIVVGLGNPGEQYRNNRHNVGFMFLDKLSDEWERGPNYLYSIKNIAGRNVLLVKPQTFMNLSGKVFRFLNFERPAEVLVVYDDLDLPLGRLRIRKDGSAGGHNGVKSIIEAIGQSFPRIRIGIGPRPNTVDAADFVLSDFTVEEVTVLDKMLDVAAKALHVICSSGIDKAMSIFNAVDLRGG